MYSLKRFTHRVEEVFKEIVIIFKMSDGKMSDSQAVNEVHKKTFLHIMKFRYNEISSHVTSSDNDH